MTVKTAPFVVRQFHVELAKYVNARSGLDPVSPQQVAAVLSLRYAETERKPKPSTHACEICGAAIEQSTGKGGTKRFCSAECRKARDAQRNRSNRATSPVR